MQTIRLSICAAPGTPPCRKLPPGCRAACRKAAAVQSGGRRQKRRSMAAAAVAAAPEAPSQEGSLEPSTSYSLPQVSLEPSTSYSAAEDAEDAESRVLALAMAKVAWETKGEDLLVLHVAPLVYWTRYLILVTVFSRPQLNAMLVKMEQEAAARFGRVLGSNQQIGRTTWELLDFGSVVVNVMTEDQRQHYDLESFYQAAEALELPFAADGAGSASWTTKL